jgi:cytochrome b6-f complex iron-sulfur subunit
MTRKEFISQVGTGAAILLLPACITTGLSSCKKNKKQERVVDFTIDISSGPLAQNGGSLIKDGVIVAKTNGGAFLAIDSACSHEGTAIQFVATSNSFSCPLHGAKFDAGGNVTQGPATKTLKSYKTQLNGSSLHVFS